MIEEITDISLSKISDKINEIIRYLNKQNEILLATEPDVKDGLAWIKWLRHYIPSHVSLIECKSLFDKRKEGILSDADLLSFIKNRLYEKTSDYQ
ncbi:MAG: hypothetical protein ACOC22_03470 [bacterium]